MHADRSLEETWAAVALLNARCRLWVPTPHKPDFAPSSLGTADMFTPLAGLQNLAITPSVQEAESAGGPVDRDCTRHLGLGSLWA